MKIYFRVVDPGGTFHIQDFGFENVSQEIRDGTVWVSKEFITQRFPL
jgi:hypothetical protein